LDCKPLNSKLYQSFKHVISNNMTVISIKRVGCFGWRNSI